MRSIEASEMPHDRATERQPLSTSAIASARLFASGAPNLKYSHALSATRGSASRTSKSRPVLRYFGSSPGVGFTSKAGDSAQPVPSRKKLWSPAIAFSVKSPHQQHGAPTDAHQTRRGRVNSAPTHELQRNVFPSSDIINRIFVYLGKLCGAKTPRLIAYGGFRPRTTQARTRREQILNVGIHIDRRPIRRMKQRRNSHLLRDARGTRRQRLPIGTPHTQRALPCLVADASKHVHLKERTRRPTLSASCRPL